MDLGMMKKELVLDDSRRLTGKNLLMDLPSAIIDVTVTGHDKSQIVEQWQYFIAKLQRAVGWQNYACSYRLFDRGISLAVAAPIDALYAAVELNEAAWAMVVDAHQNLTDQAQSPVATSLDNDLVQRLKTAIKTEQNAPLMALISASEEHAVAYLWDDDAFSLGLGPTAQTWPIEKLPDVSSVDWQRYSTIPVVYVTGTNGKSTTVRIMAEIFKQAGKVCGVTSTDFIRAGERLIDTGDYSGPGGARMLLRQNDVEVAVLEVARGGLLRRGLPIPQVNGAIITNVAEDHLGQYGINDIAALAETKFLVAKGLASDKVLVLNADDHEIVKHYELYKEQLPQRLCWFSQHLNSPLLEQQRLKKQPLCYENQGALYYECDGEVEMITSVAAVPMTLQGAAQHNVLNALGAIGLAKSLNVSSRHVANGLQNFKSDGQDNPGRGNFYQVNGATVVVDFAHNVHSMQAMANTLEALPARKKWLMLGHAGDRSDTEINNLTDCIMSIKPDYLLAVENPEYLRGRELGEIPRLITHRALKSGMSAKHIYYADTPSDGTSDLIKRIEAGDLVFLMVLSERDKVVELLSCAH